MPGHGDEPRRRLKPQELVDPRRVERKIETRAYADLQYAALGCGHRSLAIGHETAVSHRQIDEMRQYAIRVEAHGLLPPPVPPRRQSMRWSQATSTGRRPKATGLLQQVAVASAAVSYHRSSPTIGRPS